MGIGVALLNHLMMRLPLRTTAVDGSRKLLQFRMPKVGGWRRSAAPLGQDGDADEDLRSAWRPGLLGFPPEEQRGEYQTRIRL